MYQGFTMNQWGKFSITDTCFIEEAANDHHQVLETIYHTYNHKNLCVPFNFVKFYAKGYGNPLNAFNRHFVGNWDHSPLKPLTLIVRARLCMTDS